VGNQTHDDAAVYDLGQNQCLISTTDFFTPIVDDATDFGKIAAANAISDVYAMGGKPIMAIAILGWPVGKLPNALAREVLNGAQEICRQVNIPLAGGHSIDAPEPFFGLSVNGLVYQNQLKRNNTARPDDLVYLTKPIGSGILSTAQKRGVLQEKLYTQLVSQLVEVNTAGMVFGQLNGVSAMTDITGFALTGHLLEMCNGSQVSAHIEVSKIPLLEGVDDLVKQFVYPDNTMRNYQAVLPFTQGLTAGNMFVLCDPQTNGGLLVTVNPEEKEKFVQECQNNKINTWLIGQMKTKADKSVYFY
jgi:selenide,water dikinase